MKLTLYLLVAVVLMLQGIQAAGLRRSSKSNPDNKLEPNVIPRKSRGPGKFIQVTQHLAETVEHIAGTLLVLQCEVVGSPSPTVQWLKNDVPVVDYDLELNEILKPGPNSLAGVLSRLVINEPSENSEDTYTCYGKAGSKSAISRTTVFNVRTPESQDLEVLTSQAMKPYITAFYNVAMESIGRSLVLPCNVRGIPRPEISWVDNNNDLIFGNHPRMRVLESGELMINTLLWADMGAFICTAKNAFGEDSMSAFIYPVKAARSHH